MTPVAFEYAVIRAVPRVDRGEFVNVAVVLYCQARDYLGCLGGLDPQRILALDPSIASVRVFVRKSDTIKKIKKEEH